MFCKTPMCMDIYSAYASFIDKQTPGNMLLISTHTHQCTSASDSTILQLAHWSWCKNTVCTAPKHTHTHTPALILVCQLTYSQPWSVNKDTLSMKRKCAMATSPVCGVCTPHSGTADGHNATFFWMALRVRHTYAHTHSVLCTYSHTHTHTHVMLRHAQIDFTEMSEVSQDHFTDCFMNNSGCMK